MKSNRQKVEEVKSHMATTIAAFNRPGSVPSGERQNAYELKRWNRRAKKTK